MGRNDRLPPLPGRFQRLLDKRLHTGPVDLRGGQGARPADQEHRDPDHSPASTK
jgi:hypothetical protein